MSLEIDSKDTVVPDVHPKETVLEGGYGKTEKDKERGVNGGRDIDWRGGSLRSPYSPAGWGGGR